MVHWPSTIIQLIHRIMIYQCNHDVSPGHHELHYATLVDHCYTGWIWLAADHVDHSTIHCVHLLVTSHHFSSPAPAAQTHPSPWARRGMESPRIHILRGCACAAHPRRRNFKAWPPPGVDPEPKLSPMPAILKHSPTSTSVTST